MLQFKSNYNSQFNNRLYGKRNSKRMFEIVPIDVKILFKLDGYFP